MYSVAKLYTLGLSVKPLPRPQGSLLGRARRALGYGIVSAIVGRLAPPVFPRYRLFTEQRLGQVKAKTSIGC